MPPLDPKLSECEWLGALLSRSPLRSDADPTLLLLKVLILTPSLGRVPRRGLALRFNEAPVESAETRGMEAGEEERTEAEGVEEEEGAPLTLTSGAPVLATMRAAESDRFAESNLLLRTATAEGRTRAAAGLPGFESEPDPSGVALEAR